MAGRERTIKVTLQGDASSLRRAFGQTQGMAGTLGGSLKRLAGVAGFAGLALAIKNAAVASVEMAIDFERSMAKIVGLVGVGRDQVKAWEKDILSLAGDTAQAPTELADAMFFVTSAGLRGQEALDVLNASARAAAAGLGETKTVADLVTSAVNAYGSEVLPASAATDVLVNAVREGKAEAEDLAASMGRVLPVASQMGVSFNEVAAAVAAQTRTGTDASTANTQLRAILVGLLKPAQQAEEQMQALGTSSADMRQKIKEEGLLAALRELRRLTEGNDAAMAQIFPNVRALAGVLDLTGANAADNAEIFASLEDSTGKLDEAFSAMEQTSGFKLQQSLTKLKAVGTEVGGDMLPLIAQAVEDAMPALEELLPALGEMAVVLLQLASTIGPTVASVLEKVSLAVKGLSWAVSGVVGLWDENARKTNLMIEAQENLRYEMTHGGDAAVALANSLLHLARNGELTEDQFEALAEQSGLSEDRIDDVRRALLDYAKSGKEAEVTTLEVGEAMGFADEGAKNFARGGRGAAMAAREAADATGELSDEMLDAEDQTEDLGEDTRTLAERLTDAAEAQESLSGVLRAAASPVFDLADKFSTLRDRQQKLNELQKDGKKGTEEWNEAQLDLASALLETQAASDSLSPDQLEEALEAIGTALGTTKEEARGILENLGILDGKKVVATVEVRAPTVHYEALASGTVRPSLGGVNVFEKGGIARARPGGTLGLFGEAGDDEMITPLDERGLRFLVDAMRRAGVGGGGGGNTYNFNTQADPVTIAREIAWRERTSGV